MALLFDFYGFNEIAFFGDWILIILGSQNEKQLNADFGCTTLIDVQSEYQWDVNKRLVVSKFKLKYTAVFNVLSLPKRMCLGYPKIQYNYSCIFHDRYTHW